MPALLSWTYVLLHRSQHRSWLYIKRLHWPRSPRRRATCRITVGCDCDSIHSCPPVTHPAHFTTGSSSSLQSALTSAYNWQGWLLQWEMLLTPACSQICSCFIPMLGKLIARHYLPSKMQKGRWFWSICCHFGNLYHKPLTSTRVHVGFLPHPLRSHNLKK